MRNPVILFLAFFSCLHGVAQTSYSDNFKYKTVKISYEILVNKDELPEPSTNPQINARWDRVMKSIPSLEFILIADREGYLFSPAEMLHSDFYEAQKSALIAVGGDQIYYRNENVKLRNTSFSGETFNITIRKEYDWEITNETKEILGFSCYKATSSFTTIDPKGEKMEVDLEAWFAPEINIAGGPLGMDNLPGMVLEATKGKRFSYYASKIDFTPNLKKDWKAMPKASETREEAEYENLIKKILLEIRARG